MFRASQELKEEVQRRSEENNCTMTSYIEFLILQDLEDNPKPKEKSLYETSSTGEKKKFLLKRRL